MSWWQEVCLPLTVYIYVQNRKVHLLGLAQSWEMHSITFDTMIRQWISSVILGHKYIETAMLCFPGNKGWVTVKLWFSSLILIILQVEWDDCLLAWLSVFNIDKLLEKILIAITLATILPYYIEVLSQEYWNISFCQYLSALTKHVA